MTRVLKPASALDDHVRQVLVETLYTQPNSLVLGAVCGILTSWGAVLTVDNPVMIVSAALLSAVAVARVITGLLLPRRQDRNAGRLEIFYEIGAFAYSSLCGLLGAEAIYYHLGTGASVLLVANAIGYGAMIAARNAGRPAIAIGQTLLANIPVIVAGLLRRDGTMHFLALSVAMAIPAAMAITLNTFGVLRDSIATAETSRRLAEKMQHLARTDVVTGLLNRAGLNHQLVQRMAQLGSRDKLALFWLDLDRFKEVNDTLGHQVGDRLLAEVASRLTARAPEGACVARFGGDEFIIACEVADRRETETLASGLLEAITRPIRIDDARLEIGSSIGIAILPDDGADLETVMQGADLALYHAKVNGRKQASFFAPSMTRNLVRRKEIESELRLALQRDELSVFFQPIIDLSTGRIRAFEALVRWFHPDKGELRPDEFIPVAEETGAIITLGNWITTQAARCAASWPAEVTVAVNLSPLQIRAPGAALGILNALREARLDPHRLELEITETVLLDQSETTEAFISELADVGVRFALDDFGTGYSSLSYLNKYPFSKIKVDRSFVSGVSAGMKSEAIIRAVSGMASTLGMDVVAEGLETVEQVEAVKAAGCTLGQGFYFSRAMPDYLATMLLAQERQESPRPLRA
ncbi:MAG: EAL domain-containing protein [Sphingomonadales bacterium]|nr:EAL domain-containing protein [Sphingomonadales bacterium]